MSGWARVLEGSLHSFCIAKLVEGHWPFLSRVRAHSHRPMTSYSSGPGHSPQRGRSKQPRNIRSEEVTSAQLRQAKGSDWAELSQTTQLSLHINPEPNYPILVRSGWQEAPASYQIILSFSRHLLLWDTEEWARAKAGMWSWCYELVWASASSAVKQRWRHDLLSKTDMRIKQIL